MSPRLCPCLLGAVAFALPVAAQSVPEPEPGSEIVISLVTMGPGDAYWERFGHNAIWVRDAESGTDAWYNYGMFSFRQENFYVRFFQGRMEYWMAAQDPAASVAYYMSVNRSVWVQELNLTPAQRIAVRDFLRENDTDANRFYRYDYYFDNCSTRVRDVLDRALGGALRGPMEAAPAAGTFRFHTQRLTSNNPWVYTGLLIGLGPLVDEPATAWEEAFLPLALREHVASAVVPGPDGAPMPLVRSERTLFTADRPAEGSAPPRWAGWYLLIGAALAVGFVALAKLGVRRRAALWSFVGAATLWQFVVGLLGTGLALLWAVTDHRAAYANENLFLFNPIWLAVAALFVISVWRPRAGVWAYRLSVIGAGFAVLGWVVQALPGLDQVNGQLYALMVFPHLATAAGGLVLSEMRPE